MDREAVIERMAIANVAVQARPELWNQLWADSSSSEKYNAEIRAEAALDASGLLPHLEALQAELRHLKGRPAVPGKPLELQTRDELLAEVMRLQAELARKDATLRLTARWFALNADEFDETRKADSESVVAEIGKALSPAPATEKSA